MALSEDMALDKVEVVQQGILQVRWIRRIYDDGSEIVKTYYRTSFFPGSDVSKQPKQVRDIAKAVWTKDVVAAYKASIEV